MKISEKPVKIDKNGEIKLYIPSKFKFTLKNRLTKINFCV